MSGLSSLYYPLTGLQEVLVNKTTGIPLVNGTVKFFSDTTRSLGKNVYALTGISPDYTYASLGVTLTLSAIGTFVNAGSNFIPYLKSVDSAGNTELYYIEVYDSAGNLQFSVPGLPNLETSSSPLVTPNLVNLIPNPQFLTGQVEGAITSSSTNIAYGGWQYICSYLAPAATDAINFLRFDAPISNPSGNPRYACGVSCTNPNASDTYKILQVKFEDVNRFSDPTQQLTLFFSGKNNNTGIITPLVKLHKNFGAGGSSSVTTSIGTASFGDADYTDATFTFPFGSNIGQVIGAGDDDYFSIQISFPATTTFDVSLTNFVLYVGDVTVASYPFSLDPIPAYSALSANYATTAGSATTATTATNATNATNSINATNATYATNIANGGTWQIPYQTAANTTGFIGPAANTVLIMGSGAPGFSNTLPTGIDINNSYVMNPVTGVTATANYALYDIWNHPFTYTRTATANSGGDISLNIATGQQLIGSIEIGINPGTYLINYGASVSINTSGTPGALFCLVNLFNKSTNSNASYGLRAFEHSADVGINGGSASEAVIITVSSYNTFGVMVNLNATTNITAFYSPNCFITAVRIA